MSCDGRKVEISFTKSPKRRSRAVTVAVLAAVIVAGIYFVGSGFGKRADVMLLGYSVSEDGGELVLSTGIASSAGYTRGFENSGGGVKPHYLTFYSTFGGINSSLGAENEFKLELDETDSEIYFNRAGGGYELVLSKNAQTGEWERPMP